MIPVILAGGCGSRLWPLSREQYPKQLLRLLGEHSLLQVTVLRAIHVCKPKRIILVVNAAQRFLIEEQLAELDLVNIKIDIVLEPARRDTAPAIALAALLVDPDECLWIMPADHVLEGESLDAQLHKASVLAHQDYLVTFGIKPTSAETSFGYIESGDQLEAGGYAVKKFHEKPNASTAQKYIDAGCYYWNSGMFVFTAGVYLGELKKYQSNMYHACESTIKTKFTDLGFIRFDEAVFKACKRDSIDFAIMEHTLRAAMLPLEATWDDIGSWSALHAMDDKDENNNVAQGDVVLENCQNCYVRAESKLIATVGLNNIIVVETPDAVLVADKSQDQVVKSVVKQLESAGRIESQVHQRRYQPWGYSETVTDSIGFQVKRVMVKPGCAMALQRHQQRAEHWVVLQGAADVVRGEEKLQLQVNQSIAIPVGTWHQLKNTTNETLLVIEVQTGVIDEADIERKEVLQDATIV